MGFAITLRIFSPGLPRPRRRLTELMQMVSTTPTIGDACRTCQINFLLSPKEILGHQNATGIKFVRNELQVCYPVQISVEKMARPA